MVSNTFILGPVLGHLVEIDTLINSISAVLLCRVEWDCEFEWLGKVSHFNGIYNVIST